MARIKTTIAFSILAHGLVLASIGFVVPNGTRFGGEELTPVELVSLESGFEEKQSALPLKKAVQAEPEKQSRAAPRPSPAEESREEARREATPEPAPAQAPPTQAARMVAEAAADRKIEVQPAVGAQAGPLPQLTAAKEDRPRQAGAISNYEAAFNSYVIRKIDRAKLYPNWARQRGYEGNVRVRFRLSPDGSVSELKVVGPCECDILNKAACEAIRRAAPFNDGPANENGERVMEVNIGFRLRK